MTINVLPNVISGRQGNWYFIHDRSSANNIPDLSTSASFANYFIGKVTDNTPPQLSVATANSTTQEPDGQIMTDYPFKTAINHGEGSVTFETDPQSVVQARLRNAVVTDTDHVLAQRLRTFGSAVDGDGRYRELVWRVKMTGFNLTSPNDGQHMAEATFVVSPQRIPYSWFIPDITIDAADMTLNMNDFFYDARGLTFAVVADPVVSSSAALTAATISNTGATAGQLTLTPHATATGDVTVTVTATPTGGIASDAASQSFVVTVD